jgi:GNAT superfamily N-acetyltransferase/nitroimidazol reductase NimA-like FMN-containing flavoprotein (pyridoxamine 5'-phosphate oxidase superfamily)
MRKPMYALTPDAARRLLANAPAVHLCTTTPDGAPVFRTLNGAICGDVIAFHGAPVGEKSLTMGRPCVVAWDETIAQIPSYFVDPERACPATTFYRSVQVHGVLTEVTDRARKARVMAALMAARQPEGGHVPIDPDHPLYRKALEGILVFEVPLAEITGKAKLGQNRSPAELVRLMEHLWRRGDEGDARAIELVRAHNPEVPAPAFLAAPPGITLRCLPEVGLAAQAAELLLPEYWNTGLTAAEIAAAHRGSPAWVAAVDAQGALVATARAISDRAKRAWIYDVCVARAHRGRGLGKRVVALLLDHPAVRHARTVWLSTRDAQGLYEGFGFVDGATVPPPPYPKTDMLLRR